MDIVTFETAKRLKEAGFPQPEPTFGQIWYNGAEAFVVVKFCRAEEWSVCPLRSADWVRTFSAAFQHPLTFGDPLFAPSATDILRELGERYHLVCVGGKNWIIEREISTSFEDSFYGYVTETAPIENHENPAEACALAWLQLNSK